MLGVAVEALRSAV